MERNAFSKDRKLTWGTREQATLAAKVLCLEDIAKQTPVHCKMEGVRLRRTTKLRRIVLATVLQRIEDARYPAYSKELRLTWGKRERITLAAQVLCLENIALQAPRH